MQYLKKQIFTKTKIALLVGMSPSLFSAKLNNKNYNKFNPDECELINRKIKEQFQEMPDVLRLLLVDFCEELNLSALDLLRMGEFEYVVDNYMNKMM